MSCAGDDGRVASWVRAVREPGALTDTRGYTPDLTFEQKVRILESVDVTERLALALEMQRERLTALQIRRKIAGRPRRRADRRGPVRAQPR